MEKIAANGRDFALRHYSPKKIAERLLKIYNKHYK
jgi:glycosyltransferase involved in cell wall biosynthesis